MSYLETDKILDAQYRMVGLNADFCVKTWLVAGDLEAGMFIVDNEENETYTLCFRLIDGDGESEWVDIATSNQASILLGKVRVILRCTKQE